MTKLHTLLEQYGLEHLYELIKEVLIKAYVNRNYEIEKKDITNIAKKYNIKDDVVKVLLNLDLLKEEYYNYIKKL